MKKKNAFLVDKLFNKNIEKVPTRNGYGEGIVEAGKKDKNVVALCGDLTESTRTEGFSFVKISVYPLYEIPVSTSTSLAIPLSIIKITFLWPLLTITESSGTPTPLLSDRIILKRHSIPLTSSFCGGRSTFISKVLVVESILGDL